MDDDFHNLRAQNFISLIFYKSMIWKIIIKAADTLELILNINLGRKRAF